MINNSPVTASDILELKQRINKEFAKRSGYPDITALSKSFTQDPSITSPVLNEHIEKTKNIMLQIRDFGAGYNKLHDNSDSPIMNDKLIHSVLDKMEAESMNSASTTCRSACMGYCYGSCVVFCSGCSSCTGCSTCTGCGTTCGSTCTSCGGTCSGCAGCTGSCGGCTAQCSSCTGCSATCTTTCGTGCAYGVKV